MLSLLTLLHLAAAVRVFILPHSHDDVGWVRTVDQYYEFFVRDIYSSAVRALNENPQRKFQAVEQAFFSRWWAEATADEQLAVRSFVTQGRWEFAVGGWVMPDEGITDYPDIIETMTLGHRFLYDTLGVRPRFGFQVDPFGASAAFATFSALMGFDAHVISRINFWDKARRQAEQRLEFVWQPNEAMSQDTDPGPLQIFTHIMDAYSYNAPSLPLDFQLQHLCGPPHNQSDCPGGGFYWDGDNSQPAAWWAAQWPTQGFAVYPAVNSSNVQFYADYLADNARMRSQWFSHDNLLWPFGTDFQHFNASAMFASMDLIIEYIMANRTRYSDVSVHYATLSDYFEAVYSEGITWPVRDAHDFFPYSLCSCGAAPNCSSDTGPDLSTSPASVGSAIAPLTLSGYYASHAFLKIRERQAAAYLRAVELIVASASWTQATPWATADSASGLEGLRRAIGTLQHHDAVSGTMGPGNQVMGPEGVIGEVAQAYLQELVDGVAGAAGDGAGALAALVNAPKTAPPPQLLACLDFPLSAEPSQEPDSDAPVGNTTTLTERFRTAGANTVIPVVVYNPLSWERVGWLRLGAIPCNVSAVNASAASARSSGGVVVGPVRTELLPRPDGMWNLFVNISLPALGYVTVEFYVSAYQSTCDSARLQHARTPGPSDGLMKIQNSFFALTFNETQGGLVNVQDLSAPVPPTGAAADVTVQLAVDLAEYVSRAAVVNTSGPNGTYSLSWADVVGGSYAMHVDSPSPLPVTDAYPVPILRRVVGETGISEVWREVSPSAIQIYRLYPGKSDLVGGYIELEHVVGPLAGNRELVLRLVSDIDSTYSPDLSRYGCGSGAARRQRGRRHSDEPPLAAADPSAQDTDLSTFYTDNNGFQIVHRLYNATVSQNYSADSRFFAPNASYLVSGNYYPVVRRAFIRDRRPSPVGMGDSGDFVCRSVDVLVAQSGGVTSPAPGVLELMLHRRLLQDDALGACQVFAPNGSSSSPATYPWLNDTSMGTACSGFATAGTCRPDNCPSAVIPMNVSTRISPRLWIIAAAASLADASAARLAQALNNPPVVFSLPLGKSILDHSSAFVRAFSVLAAPLPDLVHATLRVQFPSSAAFPSSSPSSSADPNRNHSVVLRLQSLDEEHTATLTQLFARPAQIACLTEVTLSTVWPLVGDGALQRLDWTTDDESSARATAARTEVTLNETCNGGHGFTQPFPLEIAQSHLRTFLITPRYESAPRDMALILMLTALVIVCVLVAGGVVVCVLRRRALAAAPLRPAYVPPGVSYTAPHVQRGHVRGAEMEDVLSATRDSEYPRFVTLADGH